MSDLPERIWACMGGPMVGMFVSGGNNGGWPEYVRADTVPHVNETPKNEHEAGNMLTPATKGGRVMVRLVFCNADATPKTTVLDVSAEAVPDIMAWYGAYCSGDRYKVTVDGRNVPMDQNGEPVIKKDKHDD